MDFFARQDQARRSTLLLIAQFSIAVAGSILLVYFLPVVFWHFYKVAQATVPPDFQGWYPELFIGVCGVTLMVVLGGAALKIAELRRGGGSSVATLLGGREILPSTEDFYERRLRNVVEEMAIASGVPVPPVYVMPREKGINAFAAGFGTNDAVVAVTYGTMTGLTRDELQGVIAHEFSHILNKDMALNIQLIGFLHGLLIIGLTGRVLLHFSGDIGRSRNGAKLAFPILAAALILLAVGFTGYFFGNMIKASISRHRERLADASAVQFTRNPGGLASALKKIGGLAHGSRINCPQAGQASHMFFGSGVRSLFSTHPPLKQRIQWLEPGFNGKYEAVTLDSIATVLAQSEGAPRPVDQAQPISEIYGSSDLSQNRYNRTGASGQQGSPSASDTPRTAGGPPASRKTARTPEPINGHQLLESVGRPMEKHVETAKMLIASIPDQVREAASTPYGARMLVYFLLLDPRKEILNTQMNIIEHMAEPEVFQSLENALPSLGTIDPALRLPIVDLTIPALRFLSEHQYDAFMQVVDALAAADQKTDLFEFSLQHVLKHHLDPVFGKTPKRPIVNYYAIRGLAAEASTVLSALARKCHPSETDASDAFLAGAAVIQKPKTELQFKNSEECTWDRLDAALNKFNESSSQVKKELLAAALACMMHDHEITVSEVELFRAIAVTLDCPVPPWVTPIRMNQ
ncbi:M48 family metalloprotease [Pontiella agarivorans]|uniref:M48 family metalloprotease n=1 Tax=Pontiella agarivorans TaxID=3038953 RepID=A0ABU5MWZ7_9BACT|nr:M48 family metalloprotease [Pontiella agarivorans]MDZ8118663.1 M48 family metalloprotease [Pontiella agarivorans]